MAHDDEDEGAKLVTITLKVQPETRARLKELAGDLTQSDVARAALAIGMAHIAHDKGLISEPQRAFPKGKPAK